jgi:hypothetical protein
MRKISSSAALIIICTLTPDKSTGRLRAKRWSGLHEENTLSTEMMEDPLASNL